MVARGFLWWQWKRSVIPSFLVASRWCLGSRVHSSFSNCCCASLIKSKWWWLGGLLRHHLFSNYLSDLDHVLAVDFSLRVSLIAIVRHRPLRLGVICFVSPGRIVCFPIHLLYKGCGLKEAVILGAIYWMTASSVIFIITSSSTSLKHLGLFCVSLFLLCFLHDLYFKLINHIQVEFELQDSQKSKICFKKSTYFSDLCLGTANV